MTDGQTIEQPPAGNIEVDEVPAAELDKRLETLKTILRGLNSKQQDRLLNYRDGQTILSVLLGLKPAFILSIYPFRNPTDLMNAIRRQVPGQFILSRKLFYDPKQVRKVIADNPDLFPDAQSAKRRVGLSQYIDNQTFLPTTDQSLLGIFLPKLLAHSLETDVKTGVILGFPRGAVETFGHPGQRRYRHFGYTFGYLPSSQDEVDRLDRRLAAAYQYAEAKLPILATRSTQPKTG